MPVPVFLHLAHPAVMSAAEEDAPPTAAEVLEELHACARYNEMDDLKMMVEGDDTAPLFDVNGLDPGGNTAVHKAAANGHVDMLKYLVELKADYLLNANKAGPLSWALLNKQKDAALYLFSVFDKKIDVLAKPDAGKSVLSEAYDSGMHELVDAVLKHSSAQALDTYAAATQVEAEEGEGDEEETAPEGVEEKGGAPAAAGGAAAAGAGKADGVKADGTAPAAAAGAGAAAAAAAGKPEAGAATAGPDQAAKGGSG